MKVSLVVLTAGKAANKHIPITLSQFLIGRDPQCNLRPASVLISKRHCAILTKGGKVTVRDFESTNGTFVNEKKITGETPLQNEDVLRVGPLSFRVMIEATPPVNKLTPVPPKLVGAGAAGAAGAAAGGAADDDSVAAMLLALQDDADATPVDRTSGGDIPSGSTVMDMIPVLPKPEAVKDDTPKDQNATDQTSKEQKKDDSKPVDKKKADNSADTRAAAAAILEKYTRRQRT